MTKTRHLILIDDGSSAEVDVFDGELEGLVIGEIEFGSEEQSGHFEPPAWMGREITGDNRYAGQSLALDGRPGV